MTTILTDIPEYLKGYIKPVKDLDLITALRTSGEQILKLVNGIPTEKFSYRYAENKWTTAEVLCHLIDSERVFTYRALTFARSDKTKLMPFNENEYAIESNCARRKTEDIILEMRNLRASTIDLFNSFSSEMLKRKGVVGNVEISVSTLGYVIVGHQLHHSNIIKERYLNH